MELVWSLSVALLVTTMMGQMFLVEAASVDVSSPNSCLGLFQDGVSSSGFYNITTTTEDGEVASLPVYCDMDRNGGGWTRVFRHDYSTLLRSLPARGQRDANIDDPEALLYSIMSMLPNMKASTEAYEFMMEWPGSKFQKPFIWRQSDIGANNTVPDFFPISIPHQYSFIGLQVSPVVKAAYSCTPRSVGWDLPSCKTFLILVSSGVHLTLPFTLPNSGCVLCAATPLVLPVVVLPAQTVSLAQQANNSPLVGFAALNLNLKI